MASLITPQLERYIAEQTIAGGTVVFDEFIFANIPGLTAANLKNHLTMPAANRIVHRQAISQNGVINENAVVYSVTVGTEIGDFDFNFIGLINKSKNLLGVAVQTDTIKKICNQNNKQGNSITRNILLEFSGAKALTNINVSAETWQIDFTVRLHGLDEKIRLTNRDLYGRAVFFDHSFLVKKKAANQYTIDPGVAYVEGVRMDLTALENIQANSLPCSIYADVVHHCTVTGAYETEIKFLKQAKADYTDTANRNHYVQILADIDRAGNVTDRRLLSPFLPKDLDDTTETKADHTGHSHRLPLASLIKRGIVKLYSGNDSDAEDMAATPKAIKTLKALIDGLTRNLNNYIPNSKKSSAIDSPSADTVATSSAVKTLNDRLNVSKIPVKGSSTMVTFDLANREHWKEQIGSVYKTTGHFQLCFHNLSTHNLTNLPLPAKSPVQLDVSIVGVFSVIRCHYLNLNRTFITNANFNSSTFTLRWHEMMMLDPTGKVPRNTVFAGGVESNYRIVIRRADARSGNTPYFWMIDNGVNIDEDITVRRVIGNIEFRAGKTGTDDGEIRSTLRTHLLTDKNTEIELSTRGAENSWRRIFTAFSKTGNLTIGATTDNGKDRLQVNGTVSATAPADSSNDNQLPNTFWVRRFVNNMVETAKRWVQEYWVKKNLNDEDLNNITAPGVYGQTANVKATAARHYPDTLAGTLLVTPSAYGVQQEYTTYTSKKYVRGKEGNNWRPWQRVDALDAVNKTGDNVLNGSVTLTRNQQGIANVLTLRNQNGGAGQGSAMYFQAVDNTHAGAVAIVDDGHKSRFEVWSIPTAGNNAFGRVERTMLHQGGNLWVKNYGWLHDRFAPRNIASLVTRRDYSKTINGTNANWDAGTSKSITVTGQVITHPDGRIVQIIHLKDFRLAWFNWEDGSVGYGGNGDRGIEIYQQLWSAMPNKIISVHAQLARSTNSGRSTSFHAEPGEWTTGWNLRKQGGWKDRFWLNLRRVAGGADEHVDLYIVVEGY